jgi:hypothetical protein
MSSKKSQEMAARMARMEQRLAEMERRVARKSRAQKKRDQQQDLRDFEQDIRQLQTMTRQIVLEAGLHQQADKLRAFTFVMTQFNLRTTRLWFLQRAIEGATNDLHGILKAEDSKPLNLSGLAMFVAFAALPELAAFGVVLKKYEKTLADELITVVVQGAKTLGKSADAAKLAASGASAGRQAANALGAANAVLKAVYDKLAIDLAIVGNAQAQLANLILTSDQPNLSSRIEAVWSQQKLEKLQEVNPKDLVWQSDLIQEFILYDMLRAYTTRYVIIRPVSTRAEAIVEQREAGAQSIAFNRAALERIPDKAIEVLGLNDSQQDMIYKRFSKPLTTNNSKRPPVQNWRDLVTHWNASFPDWLLEFGVTKY